MARRQFVSGSPLRTLSLLLAGQPAEVFAAPSLQSGHSMGGAAGASDQSQVTIDTYLLRSDICLDFCRYACFQEDALGDSRVGFSDGCASSTASLIS